MAEIAEIEGIAVAVAVAAVKVVVVFVAVAVAVVVVATFGSRIPVPHTLVPGC